MRAVLKKVYYCEFCGKRSLRSLATHEKYCTGNPDRECRMCADAVNVREIAPTVVLISPPGYEAPVIPLEVLFGITGCPACVLSLIIAVRRIHAGGQHLFAEPDFNYKGEVERWWGEVARDQDEARIMREEP